MTTSTIVLIVVVAVAAILAIAAIAWVARNKRTQHRRVEAGDIRDKAADQSHKVGQREALADETAAKARAAQAEADAKAAHAAGLQHQAHIRRSDAATARDEVNQEFERADKVDPDTQTPDDKPRQDSETRQTPGATSGSKQVPPSMPRGVALRTRHTGTGRTFDRLG
jgi:FtsZ-interacting cell division protein ZipA